MKKFRFRLRTVLRQREIVEDLRKKEVGAARQAVDGALKEREALIGRKNEAVAAKETVAAKEVFHSHEIGLLDNFVVGSKTRIGEKEKEIEQLNEEVRKRMAVYLEAFRRKRIMDRLQEKARAEHRREAVHEQEKRSNDMITVRYAHDHLRDDEEDT